MTEVIGLLIIGLCEFALGQPGNPPGVELGLGLFALAGAALLLSGVLSRLPAKRRKR